MIDTINKDFFDEFTEKNEENLYKTEALFVKEKEKWIHLVREHIKRISVEIKNKQEREELDEISYIEYTMLYSNFIERRYISEVWVYGDEWYCDRAQRMIDEIDIAFLFRYYDKLWDDLILARKRYVGKVTAQEVTEVMMNALPDYYSYFNSIVRCAISEMFDEEPFRGIRKNEEFKINVGDYMANTEPVYTETKEKDADALAEWFEERHEYEYTYGDYSGLDFSDKEFEETNFHYAQFIGSRLRNTSFRESTLIGASFYRADMEGSDLSNSGINEADFSYAKLQNASFYNTSGKAGLSDEDEWTSPGYLPVRFCYADLRGADLRFASLQGADFTGADVTGANFAGAELDDAIFEGTIGREE